MADEDDALIVCVTILVTCAFFSSLRHLNSCAVGKKRKHKTWVRRYLLDRPKLSTFSTLIPDLSNNNPERFFNYMRMDLATFEELFKLVEPEIVRKKTKFRLVCRSHMILSQLVL
jgi:hypothetical protein